MCRKISWIPRVAIFSVSTALAISATAASARQNPATAPASSAPATAVQQPAQPPKPASTQSPKELQAAAWTLLTQGATSEKSRDRSDAISALSVLEGSSKANYIIETALDDKDENIRFLATTTLGAMDARSSISKLKDEMYDDSPQVSFAAVQSLWKMGDHSGRDLLFEILNGERKTRPGLMKSKMDKAKQTMHDPKAMALIGVNEASGAFLGSFSMGVSFIEEYAKNNTGPVQALCAQMLASDKDPATIEELSDALDDKNWAVRAAAARALAKLNHRAALPKLAAMMANDKVQLARFSAAAAIIHLEERSANAPPSSSKPAATAPPAKN
jgi:HEAT repeat protein